MVELYRTAESHLADEIEEGLRDLVIAYRAFVVDPTGEAESPVPVAALPALRHDEDVITGEAALRAYLESLDELMEDWGRFQSDACILDRNGRVC